MSQFYFVSGYFSLPNTATNHLKQDLGSLSPLEFKNRDIESSYSIIVVELDNKTETLKIVNQ